MKILNRPVLIKTHTLLAAFIFPVALMFLITGALYTWGIKGQYQTSTHALHLKKPLQDKLPELITLAQQELEKRNLTPPSGQAKIKKIGRSFKLEWTGANMDITLEPTSQAEIAQLKIKHTRWHRLFVQLHKAKGGTVFKVYATIFSIALLLLLISGFMMAWQATKLRSLTLLSALSGITVFFIMVFFS